MENQKSKEESIKDLEDILEMTNHPGFQKLLEEVRFDMEGIRNRVMVTTDEKEIFRLQGHYSPLVWLSNLRNTIGVRLDNLIEDGVGE